MKRWMSILIEEILIVGPLILMENKNPGQVVKPEELQLIEITFGSWIITFKFLEMVIDGAFYLR